MDTYPHCDNRIKVIERIRGVWLLVMIGIRMDIKAKQMNVLWLVLLLIGSLGLEFPPVLTLM